MKSFRYRLQAVLTVREQAEREAQLRFARACAQAQSAEKRLRSAEEALAASDKIRRERLGTGSSGGELEQLRLHAALLAELRQRSAGEVAEARQKLEATRQQLASATKAREALVRLRDRQRRAHEYASVRAEQKVMDELAGQGPRLGATEAITEASV